MQNFYNPTLDYRVKKIFDPLLYIWLYVGYQIFRRIGIVRHNTDSQKIKSRRAAVLREEAARRGIEMVEIKPLNTSINLYKAKLKNREIFFLDMPRPDDKDDNLMWLDDKYLFKKMLQKHHLPCAKGSTFTNLKTALQYFQTLTKPVVIKPRRGSRGRHTTTYIYTDEQFTQAFKIAKQLCHRVIVEEQLFGPVYRGTVIGGKLVGVLGGTPPQITGDGKSTVQELITHKNQTKHPKQSDVIISEKLEYFLKSLGFSLDSILPKDQTIDLSEKIGVANGGMSFDTTDDTHPDTKHMFEEAAKAAGSPILGFDFMIPDITKSYKDQKSGIIECNAAPFIQLHHDVVIGKPINAAKYVWDLIDK